MAIEESALYKRWIGFLFGIRAVVDTLGNKLPERAKLKIVGASAYDDPSTSSTVLDFSTITPSQHGNLAGGALHAIATQSANGFMSAVDKTKLDGLNAAGYVTAVSVTAPITKTGGSFTPNIGISPATTDTAGSMSAADKTKLGNIPEWNVDDTANSLVQRNATGGIHATHVRVWQAGPFGTSLPMPDGAIAPHYKLDTETNFSRSMPLYWSACKVGGVSWSINDTGDIVNEVNDAFANLQIELQFPHGSKIRSIDIRSRGPGSGADALPASPPTFNLYRKNISTGLASLIGTLNDTLDGSYRGNVQTHTIDLTGDPHSVDASGYRYYLVITPEFGIDSISGYLVRGCIAHLTFPQTYAIGLP